MIKKRALIVGLVISFLGLFGSLSAKTIVVFIHGTVLPGLSLLDITGACNDTLKDSSRYVMAAQRIRNDTRFWEDQAVLGEGLWPIMTIADQEQSTGHGEDRFAVYPITRAFDAIAHWSGYLTGEVAYYAFGHTGLLSQAYRKQQGYKLYKELICLVRSEKQPVRIVICAHSHGGNIALYLADAEEHFRDHLFVDDLLLFGTPVQIETAQYAFKKPFKRVVSFFSASDTTQLSDMISTKGAANFRTFTVPHKQGHCRYIPSHTSYGQVIDMRCMVNNEVRSITHQNFWYVGRSRRLCTAMGVLPLMVVAPVYMTLLGNNVKTYKQLVEARLNEKSCSGLVCSLAFSGKRIEELSEGESQQLGKLVQFYDHDTQLSWKPTYKHRVLLLYREDFMREMLGFFSWVDLKVRLWGYRTFKSVRQWFSCQSE